MQTNPVLGTAAPVSYQIEQAPSKASQREAYIAQQRRFQALLADHNQQLKLKQVVLQQTASQESSNVELSSTENKIQ